MRKDQEVVRCRNRSTYRSIRIENLFVGRRHQGILPKNKREKACEEMRDALDIDVANIKAKIMSIRSQLGRELNKIKAKKSGQGVDENYKSNWVFWQKLEFLIPVMQAGKSRDSFFKRMFRAFVHSGIHHPTMFSACSVNMFSAFARCFIVPFLSFMLIHFIPTRACISETPNWLFKTSISFFLLYFLGQTKLRFSDL